jgi:hypothetical protein
VLDAGSAELVQEQFTEHADAALARGRRAHADRQDLLAAGQVSESDRASCSRHEANDVHGYRRDATPSPPKLPGALAPVRISLSNCLSRNVPEFAGTNVCAWLVSFDA